MHTRTIASVFIVALFLIATHGAGAADAPKPANNPAGPTKSIAPGPEASGLEVIVKSAKVDFVALKKPQPGGGFEDQVSNEKLLVVTLTITNKGQKDITYKSFNGTPEGRDDRASLTTTTRKFLPLVNLGELQLADAIKQATLKPGDTVTDALCFMAPPENVVPEILALPAKNHGDHGYWKLPIKLDADK